MSQLLDSNFDSHLSILQPSSVHAVKCKHSLCTCNLLQDWRVYLINCESLDVHTHLCVCEKPLFFHLLDLFTSIQYAIIIKKCSMPIARQHREEKIAKKDNIKKQRT